MFVQHSISRNGDSWQPMTMEMKMPTTFAVASHPEAKNYLQPQTTHPQCKQHEKVPSKSLLQQAFRNPAKSERKMDAIPSRIIPSTTQLQYDQMNYQTSPVDDYKLPEGAYYGMLHILKTIEPIFLSILNLSQKNPRFSNLIQFMGTQCPLSLRHHQWLTIPVRRMQAMWHSSSRVVAPMQTAPIVITA